LPCQLSGKLATCWPTKGVAESATIVLLQTFVFENTLLSKEAGVSNVAAMG